MDGEMDSGKKAGRTRRRMNGKQEECMEEGKDSIINR